MNRSTPDYSKYPLAALIRDVPLSTQEKVLLFVIASHKNGKSFARADTLWRQTGLGRTTFYKVRGELKDRGILIAGESAGGATTYSIRRKPVEALAKDFATFRSGLPSGGRKSATRRHTYPAVPRQTTPAVTQHQKNNPQQNNENFFNLKDPNQCQGQDSDQTKSLSRRAGSSAPISMNSAKSGDLKGSTSASSAALRARIAKRRSAWLNEQDSDK